MITELREFASGAAAGAMDGMRDAIGKYGLDMIGNLWLVANEIEAARKVAHEREDGALGLMAALATIGLDVVLKDWKGDGA